MKTNPGWGGVVLGVISFIIVATIGVAVCGLVLFQVCKFVFFNYRPFLFVGVMLIYQEWISGMQPDCGLDGRSCWVYSCGVLNS